MCYHSIVVCDHRALVSLYYSSRGAPNKAVWVRRYPYIRRSKSLGATEEFHSQPEKNTAASLYKAVILLWHTTALYLTGGQTPTVRG